MEPELLALKSGDLQGERSTFAFLGILVLACAGIRLVCMALSYLICLYRFLMVWHQIFQLNAQHSSRREEAFPPRHTSTAIRRALLSTQRSEETSCCPICLVDFDESELVSHGRQCQHVFHRDCISQWLTKHDSCPCCRQDILEVEDDTNSLQDVVTGVFEYLKLSGMIP